MKTTKKRSPPTLVEEILSIWKESDPVDAYGSGFEDCKGKLFVPTEVTVPKLLRRIEAAEVRLGEIHQVELRIAARKLLGSIRAGLLYDRPHQQVLACALALWYTVLKSESRKRFIGRLLKEIARDLRLEHKRWEGKKFSGETSKTAADSCAFLRQMLLKISDGNPDVGDEVDTANRYLREFRALFAPTIPVDFTALFDFLRKNAMPAVPTEGYRDALDRVFDYGSSAEAILKRSKKTLDKEIGLAERLIPKLKHLNLGEGVTLGQVYNKLTAVYAITTDLVQEAQRMMLAVDAFTDCYLEDLPDRIRIQPEETPPFLVSLVTSGATVVLDDFGKRLDVRIYVTKERNKSWLTLLNVLVHEATHAYQPIILFNEKVPDLYRLRTTLGIPLMEAMAFCRENELFEAVRDASLAACPSELQKKLLAIFDTTKPGLRNDVDSLEFETRIWRIIRALRCICDVEVNCGLRRYVDFLSWAEQYSGLDRELIHNECFSFLSAPGYTPAYLFCGLQYEDLQRKARDKGVSRFDFNTRANRMGLLPWTACVTKMEGFGVAYGKQ